jgi:hypothetical protein
MEIDCVMALFDTIGLQVPSLSQSWEQWSSLDKLPPDKLYIAPDSESAVSHNLLVDTLKTRPFLKTDGHFGIGNILMNLRMIGYSKQSFGILADGYPAQVEMFGNMINVIATSPDKEDFYSYVEDQFMLRYFYNQAAMRDYIRDTLSELMDDDAYAHLHSLAREESLAALHIDLFDSDKITELSNALSSSGKTIGTVYLTNLTWFLKDNDDFYHTETSPDDILTFWGNIERLCNADKTLVCDAQHEQWETTRSFWDKSVMQDEPFHFVGMGSINERRSKHLTRRAAYANGNRLAFNTP